MYLIIEDGTTIPISIVFSNVCIYVNRGSLRLQELCFHLILSQFRSILISLYPFYYSIWMLQVCMFSAPLSFKLSRIWTSVLPGRLEWSRGAHKLQV